MSQVCSALSADWNEIKALLESSGLPTTDLESTLPEFAIIREDARIVAAGAVQRFGSSVLLRSVVVSFQRRGSGLGRRLVLELERRARSAGTDHIVLLTETAATFFTRLGYCVIDRDAAPKGMQQSEEFRSLCPSSATCMAKRFARST